MLNQKIIKIFVENLTEIQVNFRNYLKTIAQKTHYLKRLNNF